MASLKRFGSPAQTSPSTLNSESVSGVCHGLCRRTFWRKSLSVLSVDKYIGEGRVSAWCPNGFVRNKVDQS